MSDPLDDRPHDSPCLGAEVTDEEIMAYADGVLADERLPAVREELANDPERMKTLEAYLKTKEAMAHALGPILVATVPERLRDTINEFAAAPAPGARPRGAAQVRRRSAPVRKAPRADASPSPPSACSSSAPGSATT